MIKKNNIIIISAITKNISISPSKFNKILYFIKNKNCIIVLNFLKQFSTDRSKLIYNTLISAISNAIVHYNLNKYNLFIREAYINQGTILKRKDFRAKGKTFLIEKKMSHLTIKISNI